jgi:hypothetical protein
MTMNPLLYKAHPLMYLTVDLLANPSAHTSHEAFKLALIYLAINLIGSIWLWQGTRKIAGFAPTYVMAYVLALPAILLYLSPMLTLLNDVIAHQFHFAERFILVFSVVAATQMLGVFYAVAIRYPRDGLALGLQDGMAVSLWMWLSTLPVGLVLLWVNDQLAII